MTATSVRNDTKTAILDAAEKLMAEHGVNGVSLRAILKEANANTAALHYHFGSREQVIEAIVARRGIRNSERRRAIVEKLLAGRQAASVHDVVDAMIDPIEQMLVEDGEAGRRFLRFMARLHSDRTGIHLQLQEREFSDVSAGIVQMLEQACPRVPRPVLVRRIMMAMDTMLQSLANSDVMCQEWCEEASGKGLTTAIEVLKDFLAGGLSARVRANRTSS